MRKKGVAKKVFHFRFSLIQNKLFLFTHYDAISAFTGSPALLEIYHQQSLLSTCVCTRMFQLIILSCNVALRPPEKIRGAYT